MSLLIYLCYDSVAAPLVEADEETSEENFLIWRLEKGVAEGSIEIPKGSVFLFPRWILKCMIFNYN